jgi:ferrous iron transport protein B
VFKQFFPTGQPVPFIMELPTYKMPNLRQTLYQMVERGWIFVREAGKVIMAISIVLWIAASFPTLPAERVAQIEVSTEAESNVDAKVASEQLRYSLAGRFGKVIEPAIEPLGFDWKIGIALFTSFAAREVVVGTLNTLYSVGGDSEDITTLKEKLKSDINPDTGKPVFSPLVAISLMIFYALAMQCMSTIAIVRRETNSWKWPSIMFTYMTALAYISSLLIYQVGSALGY